MQPSSPSKPYHLVRRPGRPAAPPPSGPAFPRVAALLVLLAGAWAPLPATAALAFAGTAGETRTFTVSTTEDEEVEDDETFTVALAVSGTTHPVTATDTATGTIRNDDEAPLVSASLSTSGTSAAEGRALSFPVRLDKAVPGGFTVTASFPSGSAVQGTDFTVPAPLTFAGTAGEVQTLRVQTTADGEAELYEYFVLALAVSGTRHRVRAPANVNGVIVEGGATSSGVSAASSSQLEDKGTYWRLWSPPEPNTMRMEYYCDIPKRVVETTDRAIRSKVFQLPCKLGPGGIPAGADLDIWHVGSGTAQRGSSGAWDYSFYHSKIRMYPGDRGTQRFGFLINDDQRVEKAESFSFALKWSTKVGYPPVWFTINESLHTFTVHIDDDDEFSLSASPGQAWEEAGSQTITVTASLANGAKVSDPRKIRVEVGAPTDTATEGTDYETVGHFDVTVPKGQSSGTGTFTLKPKDDTLIEPGERISITGSGSSSINGSKLTPRVTGTNILMTDNENIVLTASPATVGEGDGSPTVTVTAAVVGGGTALVATPVEVTVGSTGDTATKGTDYTAVADFTITIPAGQSSATGTFSLPVTDDSLVEATETIAIEGRRRCGPSRSGGPKSGSSTTTTIR